MASSAATTLALVRTTRTLLYAYPTARSPITSSVSQVLGARSRFKFSRAGTTLWKQTQSTVRSRAFTRRSEVWSRWSQFQDVSCFWRRADRDQTDDLLRRFSCLSLDIRGHLRIQYFTASGLVWIRLASTN